MEQQTGDTRGIARAGRESVGRAVFWVRCLLEVATAYLFLWDSFFCCVPGRASVWERKGLCSRAAVFRAVVFPTFRRQGSWGRVFTRRRQRRDAAIPYLFKKNRSLK